MAGFEDFLIRLAAVSNSSIKKEDCFTGEDGLLYCKKCRTARQFRHTIADRETVMAIPCKCMNEKIQQETVLKEAADKKRIIENNRKICFREDTALTEWRFENDDGQNDENNVMEKMREYADNFSELLRDGVGIILYGDVGVGKSFAAACVANKLLDMGYTCYMTNFSRIINTLYGLKEGKQKFIDDLNGYDLLVIDDLGAERDTPYAMEIETQIIDARSRCGKPIVITTNLSAEEIFNDNDLRKSRIYSRLRGMCLAYLYSGKDRRNYKMLNNLTKYKHLLPSG